MIAPELSREAIFDGLYHRRCYATTGTRTYLDFRLDGKLMGSEINAPRGASLPYQIVTAGTDSIAKIEFIQTHRRGTLFRHDGSQVVRLNGELTFDRSCWTYVRVTQTDRNMAWSSPVWVDVG